MIKNHDWAVPTKQVLIKTMFMSFNQMVYWKIALIRIRTHNFAVILWGSRFENCQKKITSQKSPILSKSVSFFWYWKIAFISNQTHNFADILWGFKFESFQKKKITSPKSPILSKPVSFFLHYKIKEGSNSQLHR